MKKFSQIIVLCVGALLVACDNGFDDDKFDKPVDERLNASITAYTNMLASAPNGWAFQYYPGGSERTMGGYVYTLNFTQAEVTALGLDLVPTATPQTSAYSVKASGGVTLSFDQYNSLLHAFANPSANNYNGLLADFEFLFVSHTDNEIILQGKKYNSQMRLIKLQESADDYMAKVVDVANFMKRRDLYEFVMGGSPVKFTTADRTVSYTYDKEGTSVTENMAYVVTDKGIRFYEPVTINGATVQDLILDKTKATLSTPDGVVVFYFTKEVALDFTSIDWSIIAGTNECSDLFNTTFAQITKDVIIQGFDLQLSSGIVLGKTRNTGTANVGIEFFYLIRGTQRGFPAIKLLNFSGTKNENEVNISVGASGRNWGAFGGYLQSFVDFIATNSPYKIEPDDASNPTKAKLTSISNPDVWFTVKK